MKSAYSWANVTSYAKLVIKEFSSWITTDASRKKTVEAAGLTVLVLSACALYAWFSIVPRSCAHYSGEGIPCKGLFCSLGECTVWSPRHAQVPLGWIPLLAYGALITSIVGAWASFAPKQVFARLVLKFVLAAIIVTAVVLAVPLLLLPNAGALVFGAMPAALPVVALLLTSASLSLWHLETRPN